MISQTLTESGAKHARRGAWCYRVVNPGSVVTEECFGEPRRGSQQRTLVQGVRLKFWENVYYWCGLSFVCRLQAPPQIKALVQVCKSNQQIHKEYPIETVGTIVFEWHYFWYIRGVGLSKRRFFCWIRFAFAISRLVRRFRLPVEIAVAKGMKTIAPVLATVRILDLFSKLTWEEQSSRDQSRCHFGKGSNYVYNTVN